MSDSRAIEQSRRREARDRSVSSSSPPAHRRSSRKGDRSHSGSGGKQRKRRVSRSRSWSEYQQRRGASRERRKVEEAEAREKDRCENQPSETVLVHDIPEQGVSEVQLEGVAWDLAVKAGSSMPNSVSFAYDEHTQEFRGFAVLEFPHKDAAKAFKDYANGLVEVEGVKLPLRYHHIRAEPSRSPERSERFDRRGVSDERSVTLIVKGLSEQTQEGAIIGAFQPFAAIKDIRHFPRRGFAFVQFHSLEESALALQKFDDQSRSKIGGLRVVAHFAKEREDGRFSAAEKNLMAKKVLLSEKATAELDNIARQQAQSENTEKALSGVNGAMWANYMQSCTQTETVHSSNTFAFDKKSGFYLDAKADLFYDPNSTYFFSTDYKKYFVYDHEVDMLCLVSKEGQKVEGGERRPLPSKGGTGASRREPHDRVSGRLRDDFRGRDGGRGSRGGRSRSRSRSRSRRRVQRSRSRGPGSSELVEPTMLSRAGLPVALPRDVGKDGNFKPIHFPGGDPLARLAPAEPVLTPKADTKKKKRPTGDCILGLVSTPAARLAKPGRVTMLSAKAPRPSPVQVLSPSPLSLSTASASASMAMPAVFGQASLAAPGQSAPAAAPGDWICEVCQRKFSSEDMLRKHERLSDLHKQNLAKLHGDV